VTGSDCKLKDIAVLGEYAYITDLSGVVRVVSLAGCFKALPSGEDGDEGEDEEKEETEAKKIRKKQSRRKAQKGKVKGVTFQVLDLEDDSGHSVDAHHLRLPLCVAASGDNTLFITGIGQGNRAQLWKLSFFGDDYFRARAFLVADLPASMGHPAGVDSTSLDVYFVVGKSVWRYGRWDGDSCGKGAIAGAAVSVTEARLLVDDVGVCPIGVSVVPTGAAPVGSQLLNLYVVDEADNCVRRLSKEEDGTWGKEVIIGRRGNTEAEKSCECGDPQLVALFKPAQGVFVYNNYVLVEPGTRCIRMMTNVIPYAQTLLPQIWNVVEAFAVCSNGDVSNMVECYGKLSEVALFLGELESDIAVRTGKPPSQQQGAEFNFSRSIRAAARSWCISIPRLLAGLEAQVRKGER
jgi:hypothetical protein